MDHIQIIPLSQCKVNVRFRISKISVRGLLRRRLLDLGFVPGAIVQPIQKSPLGDPIAYRINNTTIALRNNEAEQIFGEIVEVDEL